jgi:hypothetical protein
MVFKIRNLLVLISLFVSLTGVSQLSEGGQPLSFTASGISHSFQHVSLPTPDLAEIIEQDRSSAGDFRNSRFAVMVPVDLNPLNSGTWEMLPGGQRIWRLKLSLQGSLASSLYFAGFDLPGGVELYLYDEDGIAVKGAFTHLNNRQNGLFATELIYSGTVVLEMNVPQGVKPGNWFTVKEMTYAYDDVAGVLQNKGFGDSQFCEVNINCSPEGDNWQQEKRGVVRIQVKVNASAYWCTGSMINNTSLDKTPYLLTADHCAYKFGQYAAADDLASWLFYFNYESVTCENPQFEPQLFSLSGCTKIAQDGTHGMEGSDFYLVKLMDDIPASYNIYFNGWSIVDVPSTSGVTIHHPDGDIKKISTYDEMPESSSWQGNGLPSHWKVLWAETANNWGVTEGGSSGAPLFDNIGRLVGTLTGGLASCTNPQYPDYYGKFSYHWESNGTHDTTQLKPWLDPGNTGVISLGGMMMGVDESPSGRAAGFEVFPNPASEVVTVKFARPGNYDATLEVLDLLGHVVVADRIKARGGDHTLRLEGLQAGIYFVRVTGPDGAALRKIMKR